MSYLQSEIQSYEFDGTNPEELKQHHEYLRNLETIKKEPHELIGDDIINWVQVERNRREFVRKSEKSPYATIWDYVEPPIGTYLWQRHMYTEDSGLARLEHVSTASLLYYEGGESQWDLNTTHKIERYRSMWRHGTTVSTGNLAKTAQNYIDPIRVFRNEEGKLFILDGYKRHRSAELEKVKMMLAWVFEARNGSILNRTYYIQEAIKAGKTVPDGEIHRLGESLPLYAPTPSYQDLRRRYYPPIHQQLGALYKAVVGKDKSEAEKIYKEIQKVKARFPQP